MSSGDDKKGCSEDKTEGHTETREDWSLDTDRPFAQSSDHVPQSRQRLVDVLGFVQHRAFGSGFAHLDNKRHIHVRTCEGARGEERHITSVEEPSRSLPGPPDKVSLKVWSPSPRFPV